MSNRIVVDLTKAQYARFWYANQYDQRRDTLPKGATVFDELVSKIDYAPAHPLNDWPRETMFERAKRKGIVDVWTPTVRLQLQANHSLTYTGTKATSIWKEWNRRQFKKKG